VREFREETGLIVRLTDVAAVHSNFHDPNRQTVGVWFHGDVLGGELQAGDDLDDVAFFPLDTPPDRLAFPTDLLVIEELRYALPQQGSG
jgi:8-oxo-dGTP diphosphatase